MLSFFQEISIEAANDFINLLAFIHGLKKIFYMLDEEVPNDSFMSKMVCESYPHIYDKNLIKNHLNA